MFLLLRSPYENPPVTKQTGCFAKKEVENGVLVVAKEMAEKGESNGFKKQKENVIST